MQTEAAAEWTLEDQDAGYAMPARFFYDDEVFRREKANIFFKSWHLVAHVNEPSGAGSYVSHDIFEQRVLVVAGQNGELQSRLYHRRWDREPQRAPGPAFPQALLRRAKLIGRAMIFKARRRFDYTIVRARSAACVLAARLTDNIALTA
jgi:hypothetical protein